MNTITVQCHFCNIEFQKKKGEYRRSERLKRKHYCSMKCYGHDVNFSNIPKEKQNNPQNLVSGGWQQDKYSPFRLVYKTARMHTIKRKEYREFSITLDDLYKQWEQQNGICPLTGWNIILPKNTSEVLHLTPNRASLDRISSQIGYTPSNIRFVSMIAQYAKYGWTDQDVIQFAHAVVTKHALPVRPPFN